jgi:hypothetical protein
MRNLSGLNDLNSLNNLSLQPHFIKKITEFDVSINPGTKLTYSVFLMWDRSSKSHYFIDFGHPFFWRLWRTGMLLLTKSKGPKQKFHYSEFQNYIQTKSNLHISIRQNQIHYVKSR